MTLKLIDTGGPVGESIKKGYIDSLQNKTGIKVESESPSNLGKLEAMVKSGQQTYDVFYVSGSANLYRAEKLGLVEPLNWDKIKPEPINSEAQLPYGVGIQYVSTGMAWKKTTPALNTWADFWNVQKFPGKRTIWDEPTYALPIALLADGVAPDKLYPLDIDRAFESLKKIAPHVSVWWSTSAQPVQLLKDGEVNYAVVNSGRVFGIEDVVYTYNQGLLDMAFLTIPKGEGKKGEQYIDAINAFFHETTIAENQAIAAQIIPYPGPSKGLSALLPKDKLNEYPTAPDNLKSQILLNGKWWYENEKEIQHRWQEFKLSRNK